MGLDMAISSAVKWDAPTIELADSLRSAIKKMIANNTSVLVVKSSDEIIGVVTNMDLIRCLARGDDFDNVTVANFMSCCGIITTRKITTACIQLDETKSVQDAIGLMDLAGVHHLLVAGAQGVGIISIQDLLRLAID